MTDTNCLIKKPRCGLQAGNPVCAKCGLDTRVGGYTSQQEGEEADSKALAAWETADRKEQAELAELERKKTQEAKRQAEKERLETEARKAEEAAQALRLAQEEAEAKQVQDEQLQAKTLKRIRNSWVVAVISALMTLFFGVVGPALGFNPLDLDTSIGEHLFMLVDVALVSLLGFGVYRKNRWAAAALFAYFLFSKVTMSFEYETPRPLIQGALFGYFYFIGMLACFTWHKHFALQAPWPFPTSKSTVQVPPTPSPQPQPVPPESTSTKPAKSGGFNWAWIPAVVAMVGVSAYFKFQKAEEKRSAELFAQQMSTIDERITAERALSILNKTLFEPEMVVLPADSFQMGGNDSEAEIDEKPVHPVNVKSFAIGKYEVTQGQWRAIMGSNPSQFTQCGDNCPVEWVTWYDIQTYLQKLNQKTGQRYRLPSEAEWEYACRGGRQQKYCGSDNVGNVAWYDDNSAKTTHPVGQKAPNAFGLYDMSGNVDEWVQDWHHDGYGGAPTDGSAWLAGGEQKHRVLRGGSWINDAGNSRAANRGAPEPDLLVHYVGFRVARTVP